VNDRAAPASPYTVAAGDLHADRESVIALWKINPLQPALADAKYQWFYLDNPNGPTRQLLLHHGPQAECVGAAGMVTRQFVARGAALSAGLLTDLFVQSAHRSLLPALLLQKTMRAVGLAQHDFVYGYPNDKSLPIVRRVGYTTLGHLAKFVCLLRHHEHLGRWLPRGPSRVAGAIVDHLLPLVFRPHRHLLKGWRGEWLEAVDDRFDALWKRTAQVDGIIGVRDRRFLSWRFFDRPSHSYRVFVLSPRQGTEIAGYAVCEALGNTLHIRDMLVAPQASGAQRVLIHLLALQARAQGHTRLSFEFLGDEASRRALRAAGMHERGKTPLVVAFRPEMMATVERLDWYLTAADTEL